ncbi:MAG TPA: cell division protein ZapE [Pseudomonadales bacterium]|nr:cell division protein ZapE [Pseudomonadales bacterium]HNC69606.1 cell division protein ZapE [Pseudomonadales bacterium]
MGPVDRYHAELQRPGFVHDPAQERAVHELQRVYDELLAADEGGVVQRLAVRLGRAKRQPVTGLYMWGGVGRGKTHLMDLFFESIPFKERLRTHFHRFMRRVHRELRDCAGEKDPLRLVGARIAREARLLCFDEFFVADITDAMLLAGLFEELFARGVTLVATSNVAPDDLYRDGLQRARFLPAIEMIKRHTRVIGVDGGIDHRLRVLEQAELYHSPLDEAAEATLMRCFASLAPETPVAGCVLEVEGRPIRARYCADDVVWFDFDDVCDGPRSQNDYIELARDYHAVLIGGVPVFTAEKDDQARRFINLVDEFYDRNVKLILAAAAPLAELYAGGRLAFEFQRTVSRLMEMQSHEYLARAHRA